MSASARAQPRTCSERILGTHIAAGDGRARARRRRARARRRRCEGPRPAWPRPWRSTRTRRRAERRAWRPAMRSRRCPSVGRSRASGRVKERGRRVCASWWTGRRTENTQTKDVVKTTIVRSRFGGACQWRQYASARFGRPARMDTRLNGLRSRRARSRSPFAKRSSTRIAELLRCVPASLHQPRTRADPWTGSTSERPRRADRDSTPTVERSSRRHGARHDEARLDAVRAR